uniref:Dynamin-type G domain-containing protein n=1 Tax=Acrobeloides nanus TaxID=290746 RepID=A0A914C911_9BILA
MEELIPVINNVQDVFNKVGVPREIQFPRFVVVGAQSVGKSSVLEGIVRKEFLPRGQGIVTRTPLELRLIHTPKDAPQRLAKNIQDDWVEFEHKDKIFTDFNEVQQEIKDRTVALAGSNKNITDEPIKLTIYSERVVNLTLVDLPGLTKNKVGDQPDDIKSRIEQLVLSYITEKNTLILAVSQATNDLANSEAIEIAMRPSVDPTCERTLVVLTQLDLMNPGTDARAILQGKVIPMKLGIIGVKNRTQKDIDEGKSLAKCIEEEKFWFQTHYSELAEVNGVPYLTKRLNELLMKHVNDCLPKLNLDISEKIAQTKQKLAKLEKPVLDDKKISLCTEILEQFSNDFRKAINGKAKKDKL